MGSQHMNSIKRAYLHTLRKRGKTLLMFLILLIMSTLMLTCLAIYSASDTAAQNIRRSFTGGFSINAGRTEEFIKQETAEKIMHIPGVSGYNLRAYYNPEFQDLNGRKLAIKTEGAAKPAEGYEHIGKLMGATQSQLHEYFKTSGFKLIEGRHLKETDKNKLLISDDFAKRNNLRIGDKIVLFENRLHKQVTVEIIGIFQPAKQQETDEMAAPDALYENFGFTDLRAYSLLHFDEETPHAPYGDFNVEDPVMLDAVIEKVKQIPGLNWEACTFTKHDADYQNAREQLEALQSLVSVIIIVLISISTVLLVFILLLWIRNRIQEIGMLLAMGIGKGNILLQHVIELVLIAVFAFGLSYITSSLIAQSVASTLYEQAAPQKEVIANNITDGTSKEVSDKTPTALSNIEIQISAFDLMLIYGMGISIICTSVILASWPIMRMKPKEILTKMS